LEKNFALPSARESTRLFGASQGEVWELSPHLDVTHRASGQGSHGWVDINNYPDINNNLLLVLDIMLIVLATDHHISIRKEDSKID
jgi:hypothetical protein